MSKNLDQLIAFRVLYMLVTPFENTDAYKLGIIDKNGNALKKSKELNDREKEAYTTLHRLVFSLKKLLGKVPGGKSKLASLAAAYWLVKESYGKRTVIREEELMSLIDLIEDKKITLVEEEIMIEKFIKVIDEEGVGAVAAGGGSAVTIVNTTGPAVSTDEPAIRLSKKGKPISGIIGGKNYIQRRKKPVQMGQ